MKKSAIPVKKQLSEYERYCRHLENWPFGHVVSHHEIGDYGFLMYLPDYRNARVGEVSFSVFVRGVHTSHSFSTLDAALAFAIAFKYDGINTRADEYFMKALGADHVVTP